MDKVLNILIIEFNNDDLKAIEKELTKGNINFVSRRVVTKEGYLRELKEFKPDIVLSAQHLPQFNAEEALELLEEKHALIPFIVLSNEQSEEVAVSFIHKGADNYLLKSNMNRLPTEIKNSVEKMKIRRQKEKADRALKASEELFHLISENLNDLICVLDKEGRIIYASHSYYDKLGYNPTKLKGKKYVNLVNTEDREIFLKSFDYAKMNKETQKIEYRCRNMAGQWMIFESIGSWIFDTKGKPYKSVFIARDITERKMTENELKLAKESAEKLINIKNEFLQTLSKEVRDPLNVMMGYTSILKESNGDSTMNKQAKYLDYIETAGKNLVKSIEKILVAI